MKKIFDFYQDNKWFMAAIEAVIIGLAVWIFLPILIRVFFYIFMTVVIIAGLNNK